MNIFMTPLMIWGAIVFLPLERDAANVAVDEGHTVSLEIQFKDGKKKRIEKIPYKEKMTVLDVMNYAKKNKKIDFLFRGKKDTAFLTSIDGVKNQGSRGDNWIFRVNKKLGRKSFGITQLGADDEVTWTFGKYKP